MAAQKKVLIVEDEALIALDLEQSMLDLGLVPVLAESIEAALAAIESDRPELALLDFRVGERDTTDVAEALRVRHIPFAVCSGSQMAFLHAVFEGAPLLTKPYTRDGLIATIGTLNG